MIDNIDNMKEELANTILSMTQEGLTLLNEEIPLYIEELLHWFALYNGLMFLIGLVFLCLTFLTSRYIYKEFNLKHEVDKKRSLIWWSNNGEMSISPSILILIGLAVVLAIISSGLLNLEWLQILIAPRVWLVEYALSL